MKCPNCGFDCLPGMKFCGMCGKPLSRECPACQNPDPYEFRFCGMCGARLSDVALPAQMPGIPADPQVKHPVSKSRTLTPIDFPRERQRRIYTVLVSDLTGSTSLLERMGTESWVTLMNL